MRRVDGRLVEAPVQRRSTVRVRCRVFGARVRATGISRRRQRGGKIRVLCEVAVRAFRGHVVYGGFASVESARVVRLCELFRERDAQLQRRRRRAARRVGERRAVAPFVHCRGVLRIGREMSGVLHLGFEGVDGRGFRGHGEIHIRQAQRRFINGERK